jgi:lipopolysaccharide/colanic/teichoic acid biosynthesis glycosyltransferase
LDGESKLKAIPSSACANVPLLLLCAHALFNLMAISGKEATTMASHQRLSNDPLGLADVRLLPDAVFGSLGSHAGAIEVEHAIWQRTAAEVTAKRAIDISCALLLLIFSLPLFLLIAIVVRLGSPGPILFRQQRMGASGRLFVMYKFRTMVADNDSSIHQDYYSNLIRGDAQPTNSIFKLVDDPRIIRTGRLLRRFSLDELPQLLNVLQGNMSLVGPRPPIPYEVELYNPRERLRLQATPGLTGLWQVSGRNRLTFQQMVELDLTYIERWSLWLDLWIILRTPLAVLAPQDAS